LFSLFLTVLNCKLIQQPKRNWLQGVIGVG
jgi:hypothetical protein